MPHSGTAPLTLEPGRSWPLGAHWDGEGLNFAVFSDHALAIELCLYDSEGLLEIGRGRLPGRSHDIWHGYLRGVGPGQVYGLRAHGPWWPDRGQRFNPAKLLLDPYAREIVGVLDWGPQHFGADGQYPLQPDPRDNGASALKSRVPLDIGQPFDWGDDRSPQRPLEDMVIAELHVKGFTRLHPDVPPPLRGSYAGLAHDAAIAHLQRLGVTAVCLLPVHQHLDEQRLVQRQLRNYWGYNTVGYFCPEPGLASDRAAARDEFRHMVRRLHGAGIEVLLDVVYNHTAESDAEGPTLCWRGLDNIAWYRLEPDHRAAYVNYAGCGNTLDIRHPRVLQMVMDSLRFWVQEMHVDGFRFDLAPVLGRGSDAFSRDAPFFVALKQDPVLAGCKLIAEPWDLGPGGYQGGNFPAGWLEWNDGYRDTVRAFWLGGPATRGQFARCVAGSADRFQARRREPVESINYIVAHDGFTLRDLVSYDQRHNEANGEHNHDGHAHNLSWNCGAEGDSADPVVLQRRARLQRALLATLLLSQGTPMLAAGDALGHSQGGNNNPYCQDNEITWIEWAAADAALSRFVGRVLALRRELLPLGTGWYSGVADARGLPDLGWLRRGGQALAADDWNNGSRVLGCLIGAPGRAAGPLLLLFNAEDSDAAFTLPRGVWTLRLDSSDDAARDVPGFSEHYALRARSVVLLAAAAVQPPG